MRKLFIAAGCCGLIFFAGWAFGQQVLDASRWNEIGRQDDCARMMYVLGYTQGYEDGDSAMEKVAFVLTKGNPPDSATKALLTPQVTRIAEVEGRGKESRNYGCQSYGRREYFLHRLSKRARMLECRSAILDLVT